MMSRIEPFEGEPNKERFLSALRGEVTDRVPNFEILIEETHVSKLLGREAGNTAYVAVSPGVARPMHPADYIELCRIIGQDMIAVENYWTPLKHILPDGSVARITDCSVETRADMEKIIWPSEEDIEERVQYAREYVNATQGTGIGVVFSGACIFTALCECVIGMEDCLCMIYEDRDLFNELMSRSADYFEELVRRMIAAGVDVIFAADDFAWMIAAGVDVIFAADDFAYKTGLFVRPADFEEVWRPHFDRILAPAREAETPIIFHSDGKIDDAMEMLLDMGVDGINPLDPTSIDYREYKRRYGRRVTLFGNIDITWPLTNGTPADVEKDVREHMDVMKPGGRWIAGSSHSVMDIIPHENFVAMINAIHKYGVY